MAQSLYQQLTVAAATLGIDMRAVETDAPAIEKPSARAQRRANKDAALNELRPAAKPVVAPAKPAPVAHVTPDMSLDEVLNFTVELPKFDLPTVAVDLGQMQADFFRRIACANTDRIQQERRIRKEMADYLAESKALVQEAQVAQFWGQTQRVQDLRNAAAKREAARNALKPHLTRVMDAWFNAARLMGERIAVLDDSMALYLAEQRKAEQQRREAQVKEMERQLAEQARRDAEKAAAKAAEKAQAETARQLAAAMAAPRDAEPETNPYEGFEGEAPVDPIRQEAELLQKERNAYEEEIKKARKSFAGRTPTAEEAAAVAEWTEEWDRLGRQIKMLLDPKPTKTQRRKNNKAQA